MRISNIRIRLVFCSGMILVGCESSSSRLKESVSATGVSGYSQPGKGFKMLSREVTENVCVTGDMGSSNDVIGAPRNADTRVNPQPTNPDVPPSIITDPNFPTNPPTDIPPTFPGGGGGGDPTTPFFPTNPGTDPYESPFGFKGSNINSKLGLDPSRLNIDAGIVIPTDMEDVASLAPSSSTVGSDQGGGAAVELFYLSTINDVRNAIDASYSDSTSIGGTKGDITADVGAQIAASLQTKYRDTNEHMFILMHGLKTFPILSTDVVTNPKFNPALNKLIFGAELPAELPKDEEAMVKSYNAFRKQCGDYFIESVVRGREVWLVAIMKKSTFELTMGGNVKYSSHAGVSSPSIADAKKDMTADLTVDNAQRFLRTQVEVTVRSRGKTDITVGNFTVEDAMERLNKILAVDNNEGEGIVELKIRRYNNVRVAIGDGEVRLGDIYTANIEQKAGDLDVFAKLGIEKTWVERESARIIKTYGMDQWSLSEKFQNGVAKQYKTLLAYQTAVADVFEYCGDSTVEATSATEECTTRAKAIVKKGRPVLNLPTPYPQRMSFFIPDIVSDVTAGKTYWKNADQITQDAAKTACAEAGYSMPDTNNWKRIIEGSANYILWQRDQNPAYRPENDSAALSYPCGRFQDSYLWTNEASKVVYIAPGCASQNLKLADVPSSQKYMRFLFWTQERSRYACVKFTSR